MSGFEVAGLVLGAFSITITALEKYEKKARSFVRIREQWKACWSDLRLHRVTFSSHLKQLLLPLVADDAKIETLMANPGGESWKDPSFAAQLETRLGESYSLYLEYISGLAHVMDQLNKELGFDSDPVQERLHAQVSRHLRIAPSPYMPVASG